MTNASGSGWVLRVWAGALVVMLAVVAVPSPARACSCVGGLTRDAVEADADAIFTGTAVSTDDADDQFDEVVTTFDVERVERGDVAPDQDVSHGQPASSCSLTFTLGVRYRVVADGDGQLRTSTCSGTAPAADPAVERLGGADRTATAAAVAGYLLQPASTVLLARSDDPADALAAAPLADALDAPLLLTGGAGLDPAAAVAIERTGATTAVLLGGTAALSEDVATDLRDAGLAVDRVAGPDRFATSVAVARRLDPTPEQVVVAAGFRPDGGAAFADALAAGPLSAASSAPLVLTAPGALPPVVAEYVQAAERAWVVGGPAVVSDDVVAQLRTDMGEVVRLAGADRYGTAATVADLTTTRLEGSAVTYVATGADWPDALTAASAAAREGAPLLLVDGADLDASSATRDRLLRRRDELDRIVVVGGRATVTDATLEELLVGPGESYAEAETADGLAAVRLRVLDPRRFVFDNAGEVELEHGVGYTLERATDTGWEPVNADEVFTAQGIGLPIGARSEPLAISEQPPGHYRLTTSAQPQRSQTDGDELTVSAAFTVSS